MQEGLENLVCLDRYPLGDAQFRATCRTSLDEEGLLVLPGFLTAGALQSVRDEAAEKQDLAFYCMQQHNVYLTPPVPEFAAGHVRNREVVSSKGCITDDQVSDESPLRFLYVASPFRDFLSDVLDEQALYEYADPLSSINVHYASEGQELGCTSTIPHLQSH